MACFLVPAAEAVVTAIAGKAAKSKEDKLELEKNGMGAVHEEAKIPVSRKLHWLTNMLIGGAVLLAFEHVWHGEVTAWFPFLTAMGDPSSRAAMLHEMGTTGVMMAVFVTVVWGIMVAVTDRIMKRNVSGSTADEASK